MGERSGAAVTVREFINRVARTGHGFKNLFYSNPSFPEAFTVLFLQKKNTKRLSNGAGAHKNPLESDRDGEFAARPHSLLDTSRNQRGTSRKVEGLETAIVTIVIVLGRW